MNADTFHDTPVEDPGLWQRPEHLAAHLGLTVRTLRKWVARGRAERTRGYRGEVYYRLTEPVSRPMAPAPSADVAQPPQGDSVTQAALEQLQAKLVATQTEARAFQERTEAALAGFESARQENLRLRRELDYQRELAALPWWAGRRRRELTLPMIPPDAD